VTGKVRDLNFSITFREEKPIRSKVFQMTEDIISATNFLIHQREMSYLPKQPERNSLKSSLRPQYMSPRRTVGLQKSWLLF